MRRLQTILVPALVALILLVGEAIPFSPFLSSVVSAATIAKTANTDSLNTGLRSLLTDAAPRAAVLTGTLPTDDPR